jgi:hypothetical protein
MQRVAIIFASFIHMLPFNSIFPLSFFGHVLLLFLVPLVFSIQMITFDIPVFSNLEDARLLVLFSINL